MSEAPQLIIGGIALPFIVYLVVLALKYVGLIKDGDQARKANLIVSLLGGLVWLLVQFVPAAAPVVETIILALVGSLGAALLHQVTEKKSTVIEQKNWMEEDLLTVQAFEREKLATQRHAKSDRCDQSIPTHIESLMRTKEKEKVKDDQGG